MTQAKNTKIEHKNNDVFKNQILDTALSLFASQGYDDTSMQGIADTLGISRGPLYYYYKNKIDLFDEVVKRSNQIMEDAVSDIFSTDDIFFYKVQVELSNLFDSSHREGERIRDIVRSNPEKFPRSYDNLMSTRKMIYYIKIQAVKTAISKNELRDDTDVALLIDMLFVFHRGILAERGLWDDDVSFEHAIKIVDEVIEMLVIRYSKKTPR